MIFMFRNLINKMLAIKFEYIELFYILISSAIFYIFTVPEIIKGFSALPSFLVIPHLIGKATSNTLTYFTHMHLDSSHDKMADFILNWCTGFITLVVIAYFLNYIQLFDAKIYALLIILLMIKGCTHKKETFMNFLDANRNVGTRFWMKRFNRLKNYLKFNNRIVFIYSILLGFVAFLFVTNYGPYPYAQGGDSLTHNYVAIKLIRDNFFHFQVPYLISLSILASSILQIFNINESYVLWWAARLLLYVTYSLGLCLFSYQISGKRSMALLVPILGIFVVHHENGLIFLNDLSPKSLILILFPYALFLTDKYLPYKRETFMPLRDIYENEKMDTFPYQDQVNNMAVGDFKSNDYKHNRHFLLSLIILISIFFTILYSTFNQKNMLPLVDTIGIVLPVFLFFAFFMVRYVHYKLYFTMLLLIMITLVIIHITMGFMASILIILYSSISIIFKNHEKLAYAITFITSLAAYFLFIFQKENIINFNTAIFEIYSTSFQKSDIFYTVSNTLFNLYPPSTLYFFFAGCSILIITHDKHHLPLLFISAISFFILFLPISSVIRLFVFLNPLIAYFAACCVTLLYNQFQYKANAKQIVYIMLISIILLVGAIGNSTTEIDKVVSENGYFSHAITKEVVSISSVITNETDVETILLSYQSLPIHRYAATLSTRPFNYQYRNPPQIVKNIFETDNAESAYYRIKFLSKNTDIQTRIYLSGVSKDQYEQRAERSKIEWEKKRDYDFVIFLTKQDLNSMRPHNVSKFYNKTYFTLIYEDSEKQNYIFSVNPIPKNDLALTLT